MKPVRIVLLALLWARGLACGPDYDDAHHGLSDPLIVALETFCYRLWHPGDELSARLARGEHDVLEARAAERDGDAAAARAAYVRALDELDGYDEDLAAVATIRDRVDALSIGDAAGFAAYADARDRGDRRALAAIVDAGGGFAPLARYALAAALQQDGDAAGALAEFAALAADPLKGDASAYRVARLRVALRATDGDEAARAALGGYIAHRPDGRLRGAATAWLAYLDLHRGQPKETDDGAWWPRDAPHPDEAEAAYERILAEPGLHDAFLVAVRSLRFAWRVRPPSAAVLADPRLAAAWAFHAATDRRPLPPELRAALAAQRDAVRDAARGLDPAVCASLAESLLVAGDAAAARGFAEAALASHASATSWYLALRCRLEQGELDDAERALAGFTAAGGDAARTRDLGLRLGAAYEAAGRAADALRAYLAAGSVQDAAILADGDAPLDVIEAAAAGLDVATDDASTTLRDAMHQYLAARLVRVGRLRDAKRFAGPRVAALIDLLIALQTASDVADADAAPAAAYAVAAFWYHHGRDIAYVDSSWHRWWFEWHWRDFRAGDEAWLKRVRNLEAMTAYWVAMQRFDAIAARWPTSPFAAKALYSGACCRYWLCKENYLVGCEYWPRFAERERLWQRADLLMRELVRRFPDDPLARSEWARSR